MACKTCRREDMADACGPKDGRPCMCCGMYIVAVAEAQDEQEDTTEEVRDTADGEGRS